MADKSPRHHALLLIVVSLCWGPALFVSPAHAAAKKVVFVPGRQSHGWSGHAYNADCKLLAGILNKNVAGIEAVVLEGGWPRKISVLEDAAAIVIACDGNSLIGAESNWKALDKLAQKGVGIAFMHYALDPGKRYGPYVKNWIGGYYEQHWSVNPSWLAKFETLPNHPITRGVNPFTIHDEWYYHMRFADGMKGVTPILTAIPPDSTRKRPEGPHSGNPTVRGRMGLPEHVAWAYERPNGGRGFGCTGGHTHWVYAQNDFRKLMLNAICWIAKIEVPAGGVPTPTPTVEEMETNLQGERPRNWSVDRTKETIRKLNQR